MSELRQDRLRNHWVIIAEERADRPNAFDHASRIRFTANERCPFCVGHEEETPPAAAVFPPPPAPWQVRVTPNKYPAVLTGQEANGGSPSPVNGALFTSRVGHGRHEVLIESPEHLLRAAQLAEHQVDIVWRAYQDRLNAVETETSLSYARVFQNCGPAAGASIEHLHSQLIALPLLPNDALAEVSRLRDWRVDHGVCGLTQLIRDERDDGARVLLERDGLVAFCPYASRVPYEIWIAPLERQASFGRCPPDTAVAAGRIATELLGRLDQSLGLPDYNYLIQTAPFDRSAEENYHWRIELFPRLTIAAGFEMSSGCFINPVSPESAARTIRSSSAS